MFFNTAEFALFFVIATTIYYLLPTKVQNLWLGFISGFFYLSAAPQYGIYLGFSILLTYFSGLILQTLEQQKTRKLLLAVAIITNLSILFVFKYYDFFANSIALTINQLGGSFVPVSLGLIEPIGISYYTFTTLGYLIDVYRKDINAERNIVDYSIFVSFFPHIMSGPIARANTILPQLKKQRTFVKKNLTDGAERFVFGLMKKAVVADWLGAFNDAILYKIYSENPLTILMAVMLYSLQLYFDFSGFCDMAIGCAKMLGIELVENFKAPYFSKSFYEIWARWHISLTSWFRDYVYIPLGGNRKGFVRKLINIGLIFLISGLWHGAALGFVVWGLLHGAVRIVEECIKHIQSKKIKTSQKNTLGIISIIKNLYVYFAWCIIFVFFRLETVTDSFYAIGRCFTFSEFSVQALLMRGLAILQANITSTISYISIVVLVVAITLIFTMVCEYKFIYKAPLQQNSAFWIGGFSQNTRFILMTAMIAVILFAGRFGVSSFIYHKF